MDKSWMLNPQAIRYAKACIQVVKQELDIKLKLSHPEFLQMLHEYVDMTDSQDLGMAYSRLISMAGPGAVLKGLKPLDHSDSEKNVVELPFKKQVNGNQYSDSATEQEQEMVQLNGKLYSKWRDGKEFKGLYRGQPSYH